MIFPLLENGEHFSGGFPQVGKDGQQGFPNQGHGDGVIQTNKFHTTPGYQIKNGEKVALPAIFHQDKILLFY